jgi:hypothetical protein
MFGLIYKLRSASAVIIISFSFPDHIPCLVGRASWHIATSYHDGLLNTEQSKT